MSPRGGALRRWADNHTEEFRVLLATVGIADDSLRNGAEAMRSSADQLRAVGTAGQLRAQSHPCPDTELQDRFNRLLERCIFAAGSLEEPSEDYGEQYIPVLDEQLGMLIGDIMMFLADLGHAIQGY